jgi:hypothetical protein
MGVLVVQLVVSFVLGFVAGLVVGVFVGVVVMAALAMSNRDNDDDHSGPPSHQG